MGKKQKISPEAVKKVRGWQKRATHLLYAAMILKAGAVVLPFLEFPSGVLLFVFFVAEIFLLPPVGMALMCLMASALFFVLQNVVQILAGLMVGSVIVLFLGMALSAMLSGIILTFFDGLLISIEVITTTAPAAIGVGTLGVAAGISAATGAGVNAAVNRAGQMARGRAKGRMIRTMLGSFLTLLVVGWPSLSYSQAISGALSFKPAVILNQAHLNYFNYDDSYRADKVLFEDEENWVFKNGFYSAYINNGRNNITQGGKNLAAGNDTYFAVLLHGLLYVQQADMTGLYGSTYIPKKTDAMVLVDSRTFIFGHDLVFCASKNGSYTWKDTKWTSEFEALSREEQFEKIYEILERQNTAEELRFSYEDVGAVAYAQRNGLLLNYDGESHSAWFASQDKEGNVTAYLKSGPGELEELVTFTPDCSGDSLPYFMLGTEGILYIKGNQVKFLSRSEGWKEFNHFTNSVHDREENDGQEHDLVALNYMDLGDEGEYLIYLDEKDKICLDSSKIGVVKVSLYDFQSELNQVMVSAGDYIYSIQYKDSLLSRLTYLKDAKKTYASSETKGWGLSEIWREDWAYERIQIKKSLFIEEEPEETEEEEEEEQDPAKLYPAPVLTKRRSNSAPYDRNFIVVAKYAVYVGPQDRFFFRYPGTLYDNVDYRFENDGADIDIVFTSKRDSSYLEVSVHPLPEDVDDARAYAESLRQTELKALYNGREIKPTGKDFAYESDGVYRFRLEGWTSSGAGVKCYVNYHVDGENVMKMILRYPNGTDDEDKATKEYFGNVMNYYCGFGTTSKKPKLK